MADKLKELRKLVDDTKASADRLAGSNSTGNEYLDGAIQVIANLTKIIFDLELRVANLEQQSKKGPRAG